MTPNQALQRVGAHKVRGRGRYGVLLKQVMRARVLPQRYFLRTLLLLAACSELFGCGTKPTEVLFLGNSITYVGNLPAVFEALCAASHRTCRTEMVAEGGATLKQRIDDRSLTRSLESRTFEFVVLQERGGDYIALPAQQQMKLDAEAAVEDLVTSGRERGLKPILLGTYQGYASSSKQLVGAESALASRLRVPSVLVSDRFLCGREQYPGLRWLDADGMHPGPELTLLMATLLYRELFGEFPAAAGVEVNAPIYGVHSGPQASSFASSQLVQPNVASKVSYDRKTMELVINVAEGCAGSA